MKYNNIAKISGLSWNNMLDWNWKVIISSIIVAAVALFLLFLVKRYSKKRLKKKRLSKEKRTLNSFYGIVTGLVELLIIIVAVITILQICGVNVSSLVAGLGIAGAVVGLALQDIMKDIIMGIHIASDSFFDIGDGVIVEGREGIVLRFNMKSTIIQMLDDKSVFSVCNREIDKIIKLPGFFDIDIPIDYDTSQADAEIIAKNCSSRIEKIEYVTKSEYIGVQSLDDSNIKFRLRISCEVYRRAEVKRAALAEILGFFNEKGIKIPYNQLDIHMDKK